MLRTRQKGLNIILLVYYGVGNEGIFPTVARRHRRSIHRRMHAILATALPSCVFILNTV